MFFGHFNGFRLGVRLDNLDTFFIGVFVLKRARPCSGSGRINLMTVYGVFLSLFMVVWEIKEQRRQTNVLWHVLKSRMAPDNGGGLVLYILSRASCRAMGHV